MGSLAQQNGFDRALSHNLRSQVTQQSLTPAREECNEYDLTAAACLFFIRDHNDWFRWFAFSSLLPICSQADF